MKQVLFNGTVSVKLNGEMSPYYQSAKGVRQGDPLSPFLFSLAADCLIRMVLKAHHNCLITRLAFDLIPQGVAILQYADDTVVCLSRDLEKALNHKLLLYFFEMMSGLKINLLKSEVLCIGGDNNVTKTYSELFIFQVGQFTMQYLGVPVNSTGLKILDWDFIDLRFIKIYIWELEKAMQCL